eukprot:TRINITY_DN11012_c0_g1_i1.p1 TRINITY_DN11012_c0_g1~~TRINITY_DN11012_c0_g1_i1.p1  ORF type:complete len:271 (-),score=39.69 TRINITY_DN11012_c0_g1_i1:82-894(-)
MGLLGNQEESKAGENRTEMINPVVLQPLTDGEVLASHPMSGWTGYEILMMLPGIYMRDKFGASKALGIEPSRKIEFYGLTNKVKKKKDLLFQAKEDTNWLARQISGNKRGFVMNINLMIDGVERGKFLLLDKEEAIFQIGNGEMSVILLEGERRLLGYVTANSLDVAPTLELLDASRKVRYTIAGEACQCGIICPDCCDDSAFRVYDRRGNVLGTLRRPMDASKYMSNVDHFMINFPKGTTFEDRCLLMSSLIMMDFFVFAAQDRSLRLF